MVSIKRGFCKIYDRVTLLDDTHDIVKAVIKAGVDWLQYRDNGRMVQLWAWLINFATQRTPRVRVSLSTTANWGWI